METLLDMLAALGALLGAALIVYGAWLCLPVDEAKSPERSDDRKKESEALLGQPRPRIRAGAGR